MAKPIFKITDQPHARGFTVRLVEFEIPGGVTPPEQFVETVQAIEAQLVGALLSHEDFCLAAAKTWLAVTFKLLNVGDSIEASPRNCRAWYLFSISL